MYLCEIQPGSFSIMTIQISNLPNRVQLPIYAPKHSGNQQNFIGKFA